MKKSQKGEVVLAMMIVMLVVMLVGSGSMGMMGMGKMEDSNAHAEKSGSTKQQTTAEPLSAPETKRSTEPQN